jgi:hypothetical protein
MRVKFMTTVIMACALPLWAAPPPPPKSACEVLTKKDVAGVQGEAFAETKLTTATDGGLSVSQCFYRLPSFSKSISVTVMRDRSGSASASEAWWKARVGSTSAAEEDEGEQHPQNVSQARGEEDESKHGAVQVDGIGDEAVWSGNRMMGELDVLSHGAIIRVSVGGSDDLDQKIAKSKRLAAIVLKRM